jgi:hypothetical protein
MSQSDFYLYFTILAVLIFALSAGISYFYLKIKNIEKEQERMKDEYIKKESERKAFVKDSLVTIAKAFLHEQVEPSEACIRLRMLIDRVDFVDNDKVPTFFEMYEEIRYFKTHEARNALSLEDKTKEDKQRFAIEDKYKDNLRKECENLLNILETQ